MDNVLYLVHSTDKYSGDWTELKPSKDEGQFPGVYFTIITKENIHKMELFPGKHLLLFSRRLLLQHNYHINLRDYNGNISENNTYFPWNLEDAVHQINIHKHRIGNEAVFHDPISMEYLCIHTHIVIQIPLNMNNLFLPNFFIENQVEPDMTKVPFYCYPFEKNYDGVDPLKESSRSFFQTMAKTCGVQPSLSTPDIINEIKKRLHYLHANRNKQHLQYLKGKRTRKK